MKHLKILIIVLLLNYVGFTAFATIRLPVIFQSNMVLQRDQEISLWGYGDIKEKVVVTFNDRLFETITGTDKKWRITLPSQKAGGPYDINIKGESNTIELKSILFGDVWVCGGQSNMQYTIAQIGYKVQKTDTLNSQIRIFNATIDHDYVPKEELLGGSWNEMSAQTLQNSSATAFFFGKFLQDSLKVPIGLLSVNLGATSIETWMSPKALKEFPQFQEYYKAYLAPAKSKETINKEFEKIKPSWKSKHYLKGDGLKQQWYLPETDVSDWKTMNIPAWWQDKGEENFNGAVWFRKTFDLPENHNGDFTLMLNQIDDYDITWVNGHQVGESYGNQNWRYYQVPKSVLKPKGNVIVMRVFDVGGKGGIYSNAIWGNPIVLGDWLYKKDYKINADKFKKPHVVNISPFVSPSVLFNANIAPITTLGVKGIIWYQGESNANRAEEYRALFPALIKDWRSHFNQGNLPFLFVQLANYGAEDMVPDSPNWAELRDAQQSALKLENTGMAVAIDIGEAYDIHPRNKMDVGKRLGLQALKIAYNKNIVSQGPTFKSKEIKGDSIIIHYQEGTNQLISKNKYGYVSGFAIAGADNKFYWAKAYIKDNVVVVYNNKVKNPINVRYAWANNPGATDLYNQQNLPALPFKTDNLPYQTSGFEFSTDPWK